VAALTTVATSAPDDVLLSDTVEGTLGPGPTRITMSANRAAVNHAHFVMIVFRADGVTSPDGWSDDPIIRSTPIELTGVDTIPFGLRNDLEVVCTRDRDCEISIVVTVPTGAIQARVTASLGVPGDGGFLFPDDHSFPDDASVDVRFGP
jgi:hypothetical protein